MVNGRLTTPATNQSDVFNYDCPTFQLASWIGKPALFVQDRFTMDRVTLSLGVRFDAFNASSRHTTSTRR